MGRAQPFVKVGHVPPCSMESAHWLCRAVACCRTCCTACATQHRPTALSYTKCMNWIASRRVVAWRNNWNWAL